MKLVRCVFISALFSLVAAADIEQYQLNFTTVSAYPADLAPTGSFSYDTSTGVVSNLVVFVNDLGPNGVVGISIGPNSDQGLRTTNACAGSTLFELLTEQLSASCTPMGSPVGGSAPYEWSYRYIDHDLVGFQFGISPVYILGEGFGQLGDGPWIAGNKGYGTWTATLVPEPGTGILLLILLPAIWRFAKVSRGPLMQTRGRTEARIY